MRSGRRLIGCLIFAYAGVGIAHAQEAPTAADRSVIDACLANAKKTKALPESCIGAVQKPCLDAPDGQSTFGMKDCSNRETAVWDERLDKAYKAFLDQNGDIDAVRDGKKVEGADLIRDAERAWLAFRDKQCDVTGLPMEGGSGAGVLIDDCYLEQTAQHALWLEFDHRKSIGQGRESLPCNAGEDGRRKPTGWVHPDMSGCVDRVRFRSTPPGRYRVHPPRTGEGLRVREGWPTRSLGICAK